VKEEIHPCIWYTPLGVKHHLAEKIPKKLVENPTLSLQRRLALNRSAGIGEDLTLTGEEKLINMACFNIDRTDFKSGGKSTWKKFCKCVKNVLNVDISS
jgi:hypothetical protein